MHTANWKGDKVNAPIHSGIGNKVAQAVSLRPGTPVDVQNEDWADARAVAFWSRDGN
jgi:hypothetical protein